jgi:hypothetical protein
MSNMSHLKQRVLVALSLTIVLVAWAALIALNPTPAKGQIQQSVTQVAGPLSVTGTISGTSDVGAGIVGAFYWAGRNQLVSTANGQLQITNATRTAFNAIQFGCLTSACPSLQIVGNTIGIRNSDGTVPTFSTLPTCNSGLVGISTWISDSTTTTFYATITGGGSNAVLAACNGVNWTVH